jgi:MATE family multidrug resistance protein|tara:strand:- start:21991 stop:22290 length:300 start_codon:yes stop_codon:yes gene_type:complete
VGLRCEIEITNVRIAVIVPAMTSAHSANNPAIEPLTATQGRILALAWPIMLSNITVPLLGLVDTAILGHLEDVTYLGAVAIGSQLFTFMLWSFGFLRTH